MGIKPVAISLFGNGIKIGDYGQAFVDYILVKHGVSKDDPLSTILFWFGFFF